VIIAGVGYYFWSEKVKADALAAERQAASSAAQTAAKASAEQLSYLLDRANAQKSEPEKVRAYCENIDKGWVFFEKGPARKSVLRACRDFGYL
jgi:hypothetical protein